MASPRTYKFGPFVVDAVNRSISCGLNVTTLSEKPFQILLLLVEADGAVVSKDEFFERVWPAESSSDANLTQHIFMLRNILAHIAGGYSCILTVPGRGYRLSAPIERKGGLSMKGRCEICSVPLAADVVAYICSYECTFCTDCAAAMGNFCRNCGGELVNRPRRQHAARVKRAAAN